MIVYVSLFGALPVPIDTPCARVEELCDRHLADTIWDASKFVIERAEKIGMYWEAELAFATGTTFKHMERVCADAELAQIPGRHILFVHFETVPENISKEEFIILGCRHAQCPDAEDISKEHARVLRRCTLGRPWPHFVRLAGRSGRFDMVLSPAATMEELRARVADKMRQSVLRVSFRAERDGREILDMAGVRAVSAIRIVCSPPPVSRT
jgi:hypothetical protein